jgi:hypothetical protein
MGSQFIVVVYPPTGDFPYLFQVSEEIEGHLTYSVAFFLRPAFRRLTVRVTHLNGHDSKIQI